MAAYTISPSSNEIIVSTGGSASVTFRWGYTDAWGQTVYELRYRLSSSDTWTTVTNTSFETYTTVTLTNGEYVWQVRGNTGFSQSGWSETSVFSVYGRPTVSITTPSGVSPTITSLPISYAISYSDTDGTFASGTIEVRDGSQVFLLYSEPIDSTLVGTIDAGEFLPINDHYYTLQAIVHSSTSLTANVYKQIYVSISGTDQGTLIITNNAQTGYVTLKVGWDNSGGVHADHASLYRVVGGVEFLLAENLAKNTTIIDKYAPLNTAYSYKVVTYSTMQGGNFTTKSFANTIATDRWFAIWDGGEKSAWAEYNPTGSYSLKRPQKTQVHYVGREYPVSYDGTALDEVHSITFTVVDLDSWSNGFIELMHDGGRGVYKSVDGKVFHADFELACNPNYTSITKMGTLTITITRIEGDAL